MFTWICPQCGREVPPSAPECPTCAEKRAAAAQPPVMAPPPPPAAPPPQYQPPPQPQYQAPPQPQYQPPPQVQYQPPPQVQYQPPPPQPSYIIAEPKKGLPAWLVGILVAAVIGGALFGLYKIMGTGSQQSGAAKPALEQPTVGAAGAAGGVYGKFLEVVGYRLIEGTDKKPRVRFTVVNHSTAPMGGLQLQVSLGRAGAESEPPFAVVDANVGDVEANGTKEIDLPIKTTLRIYELPDWQFIRGTFIVTAPK